MLQDIKRAQTELGISCRIGDLRLYARLTDTKIESGNTHRREDLRLYARLIDTSSQALICM